MLDFLHKQTAEKSEYIERLKQSANELRAGKQNYLPIIYQALVSNDREAMRFAAHEIAQYMQGLDSGKLIRLDEEFRQYSSMEWTINWRNVDISLWKAELDNREEYLWAIRLGTFHPNGYFREKCIRELAGDEASVKFALLRLNDWAEQVRAAAEAACAYISEISIEELVVCLPYLEKVKQGCRRDRAVLHRLEECVVSGLIEKLKNVELKKLRKYDVRARRYLYRLLLERKLLSKDEVNQVLAQEKNGQCQTLIMAMLLKNYELSMAELDGYLEHKSKLVQRKVLEKKYSILGTGWDGLEKLLLSASAGMRGDVSYILRKHTEIDIVAYYAEHLETPYKKISILGIGENGTAKDAGLLLKYLTEEAEGIVKSAIHAISMLLGTEADDIFWRYLQDEREVVLRAAYREIVANDITFGAKQVYELFMQTKSQLLREKLAYQLLREHSWERLPYILKQYWYEEEVIRTVLRRAACGRSVYSRISKELAEEIRSILGDERYNIPEELKKSIEFDLRFVVRG